MRKSLLLKVQGPRGRAKALPTVLRLKYVHERLLERRFAYRSLSIISILPELSWSLTLACSCFWSERICPSNTNMESDLLHRIHFFESGVLHKAEASEAEDRMEDIDHVTWSIGDAALVWILQLGSEGMKDRKTIDTYLTAKDERRNLSLINPVQSIDHGHTGHDPPAITHVFELLRSAIETAVW